MPRITYISSFDGLRAIAVFFVMIYHGSYGILKGGWIGVDIFFVLSGYLITSILKNEYIITGKINLKLFYVRRLLRLLPALVICIILCNLVWNYITLPPEASRLIATLASLFYASNIFHPLASGPLGFVWSLSVEEHFYFLWPLALATIFLAWSLNKQVKMICILILFVFSFRIFVHNYLDDMQFGILVIDSYRFTFCRFDTILLGALLAIIPPLKLQQISVIFSIKSVILITCVLMTAVVIALSNDNAYWRNGGFILTNLLCVSTVLFALHSPNNLVLSNQLTQWLGRRSYGIYLYHTPIFLILENFREAGNHINLLVIMFFRFLLTMLIAEFSFRYIEQPIIKKYSPKVVPQTICEAV
jgi:peptidoglycan/LPS O-acetylase OafA/YrhL